MRLCAWVIVLTMVAAGDARAAPRGLTIIGTAATVTPAPFLPGPTALRTDLAGDVFVVAGHRISVFNADGTPRADWSVPGPDGTLLFDALPDGSLFAAPLYGRTVYRYDPSGVPLGSWSADLQAVRSLAADPRGSLLISDLGPPKRYFPDGRSLGGGSGPSGTGSIAGDGSRWVVEGTTVLGVTASGRTFQRIARDCPVAGHTPEGVVCPSRIGAFGGTPPSDVAAAPDGRLATDEIGLNRVQFFNRRGRALLACRNVAGTAPVTAIAYDRASDDVLLAAGWTVYRARLTSTRTRGCRTSPLRITRVRIGRKRHGVFPISYRLSRRARVQLVLTRGTPSTLGRRVPGRKGTNRTHVNAAPGRWYVQLKAVDAASNSADTPLMRLRR